MPATNDAQNLANNVVDSAQGLANSAIDLGEEALKAVLNTVVTAQEHLIAVQKSLLEKLS